MHAFAQNQIKKDYINDKRRRGGRLAQTWDNHGGQEYGCALKDTYFITKNED